MQANNDTREYLKKEISALVTRSEWYQSQLREIEKTIIAAKITLAELETLP